MAGREHKERGQVPATGPGLQRRRRSGLRKAGNSEKNNLKKKIKSRKMREPQTEGRRGTRADLDCHPPDSPVPSSTVHFMIDGGASPTNPTGIATFS